MKKIYIFSFLLIFSLSNIYSQSGWFWQNPLPQGNTLNDIMFSGSVGIAVGNFGTILKSTNAGLNWVNLYFSERNNLHSVSVINEFIYYVCGDSGKFYKTINGGSNWVSIQLTGKLNDLSFINVLTGCICADNNRIYRTSDGGSNWTYQIAPGLGLNIVSIQFVNDSIVYAVKDVNGIFLTSINGGISWNISIPGPLYRFTDLDFINLNTGYLTGTYQMTSPPFSGYTVLLYTQNGGVSWSELYTNNSISILRKIKMFNETFGLMIGRNTFDDNSFYITNNGINWSQLNTVPTAQPLNSISFISNSTVFMAGNGGEIFRSTNSAMNWESRIPGLKFDYNDICFVNEQTGWVIGPSYIFYPGDGVIVKTTNSGLIWNLNYTSSETLNSVYFVNSETGFATGDNGLILKTTNSGGNWVVLTSNTTRPLMDIVFTDINTGYVVGLAISLKTTNSGLNWSQMSLVTTYMLKKVDFVNQNIGVVLGINNINRWYKTTNGGDNWQTFSSAPYAAHDILFINENTGFIAGSSINKTTNGGMNFYNSFPSPGYETYSLYFINDMTGFASGAGGHILKTTNCGLNWYEFERITDNLLNSTWFVNDSIGFVAGNNGTILKTTNSGGQIVGTNQYQSTIPENYSLPQNYPNPFNPVTKIKFDIPLLRGVSEGRGVSTMVIIYDLLGREITTLVNEQLKPGTYEVEWDGTGFASGVYFYSLVTKDFVETKRMVLIK